MKVAFMGNPKFALPSLESLLQSQHEVKAVVSNPAKPMGRNRALKHTDVGSCLLYTSPSPRDATLSRMPSSA